MNRIEQKMKLLKERKETALITCIMAGLPDFCGTKALLKAQEEAGVDVIELGIPFSDPIADGPVIQQASYQSICRGTSLKNVFCLMEEARKDGIEAPVVFQMYYNAILHYGIEAFVKKCREAGVDGLIVPDLPFEEQGELMQALYGQDDVLLLSIVSPLSGARIPTLLENARGFVYCVSSMGDTDGEGAFSDSVKAYLKEVSRASRIPVMLGSGVRAPEDVAPVREWIDGAAIDSHFMQFLEQNAYDLEAARRFCGEFKQALQKEAGIG